MREAGNGKREAGNGKRVTGSGQRATGNGSQKAETRANENQPLAAAAGRTSSFDLCCTDIKEEPKISPPLIPMGVPLARKSPVDPFASHRTKKRVSASPPNQ
jgi:hypothetical protein